MLDIIDVAKWKEFIEEPKSTFKKLSEVGVVQVTEICAGEWYEKELIIVGGNDEDVARVLYENVPLASIVFMSGNTKVKVNSFDVYFSRKED